MRISIQAARTKVTVLVATVEAPISRVPVVFTNY